MRIRTLLAAVAVCSSSLALAGPAAPGPEWFRAHRTALLATLPKDAVVVLRGPAEPPQEVNDSYRPAPDFWYLTGFAEPDAVAVLRPSAPEGKRYLLFVQPSDWTKEQWTGHRAGVDGAKKVYGADAAFPVADFEKESRDAFHGAKALFYLDAGDEKFREKLLTRWNRLAWFGTEGLPATDLNVPVGQMRLVKDATEIALLKEAVALSLRGHLAAMALAAPGVNEGVLKAAQVSACLAGGAVRMAYAPIVGSGPNSVVLHYPDANRTMQAGEILVNDTACEYGGYAADVTRTYPVNGRFSPEQKALYEIVLAAQKAGIAKAVPGAAYHEIQDAAVAVDDRRAREARPAQGDARGAREGPVLREVPAARDRPLGRPRRPRRRQLRAVGDARSEGPIRHEHVVRGEAPARHGPHGRARHLHRREGGRRRPEVVEHRHPDRGRHPRHGEGPGMPVLLAAARDRGRRAGRLGPEEPITSRIVPGPVRVLPSALVDQIAAGEVVERPASAVKELVENALDAGAGRIAVDVEGGGVTRISVLDDGSGMGPEDAALALERHATSKIRSFDDLTRVATMGFRGEALPSIASVSRLVLTTSPDGSGLGTEVVAHRGAPPVVRPARHPKGTRVVVEDLFGAVPARRKFLKSAEGELRAVVRTLTTLALANPSVAFALRAGPRLLLDLPASPDAAARFREILGDALPVFPLPVAFAHGGMSLAGAVTPPAVTFASRANQWFFVNGRAVKDATVAHAVSLAAREVLRNDRQPRFALFLACDPGACDVNVHPQKLEVRFREPNTVHALVHRGLVSALTGGKGAVAVGGAAFGDRGRGPGDFSESGRGRGGAEWLERGGGSVRRGGRGQGAPTLGRCSTQSRRAFPPPPIQKKILFGLLVLFGPHVDRHWAGSACSASTATPFSWRRGRTGSS